MSCGGFGFFGSLATISFQISNEGQDAKAVNYTADSGNFVNDLGYSWSGKSYHCSKVHGLPVADNREASSDINLEPGSSINASVSFGLEMKRGQTIGNAYDLQFGVTTYKDLGEGKVGKVRSYPVQFVNLQRTGAAAALQDAGQGLKKALGGLFK